jgi:EAL domain-containing protein (putative c-di-GMP-specific phosphodiesterase class I)
MRTEDAVSQEEPVGESAVVASDDHPPAPCHLPDRIGVLADRLDDRLLNAVVVIDASHLETWEFEHGAQAFDDVMMSLWRAGRSLRGSVIREEDEVCLDAPGGDTLLIFVSDSRSLDDTVGDQPPSPSALGRLADRVRGAILRASRRHFDAPISDAIDRTRAGAAPIRQPASSDPRREIYRAIRRSRASIRGRATRRQRNRHKAIGSILAGEEISTRYQPIYRLDEGELAAYEALSRPNSSAFDELQEQNLFKVARKAELATELDELCRRLSMRRRPSLEQEQGETQLFINCLPQAFSNPQETIDEVIDSWEQSGRQPSNLVFEINENVSQQQADQILPKIQQLRDRGYQFALDDMGTGTTNLRVLAELEPSYIKMDISLTSGIGDDVKKKALASYLLDLAEASRASLIAEGLETTSDLETVRELGIEYGQGYLLGEPESADTVSGPDHSPNGG